MSRQSNYFDCWNHRGMLTSELPTFLRSSVLDARKKLVNLIKPFKRRAFLQIKSSNRRSEWIPRQEFWAHVWSRWISVWVLPVLHILTVHVAARTGFRNINIGSEKALFGIFESKGFRDAESSESKQKHDGKFLSSNFWFFSIDFLLFRMCLKLELISPKRNLRVGWWKKSLKHSGSLKRAIDCDPSPASRLQSSSTF